MLRIDGWLNGYLIEDVNIPSEECEGDEVRIQIHWGIDFPWMQAGSMEVRKPDISMEDWQMQGHGISIILLSSRN